MEDELFELSETELRRKIFQNEIVTLKQIENEYTRFVYSLAVFPIILNYFDECLANGLRPFAAYEKRILIDKINKELIPRILSNLQISVKRSHSYGEALSYAQMRNRTTEARLSSQFKRQAPENIEKYVNRKTRGLTLSNRVWRLKNGMLEQIEAALQVGISEGKSAHDIAMDLKKYLKEPDRLFRRVRDADGELKLSRAAKNYRPGRGVYRSSYQNALRLATNEINKAYRVAQWEQWQDIKFIVGYEVKRSNHKYDCPVCEALKGKYPKTFKWSHWHVRCRCFVVPILASMEEFLKQEDDILADRTPDYSSENTVTDFPAGFKKWIDENKHRYRADTLDWVEDNEIVKEMFLK